MRRSGLRRIQLACLLRAVTAGLTAPYLYVYLTQVRNFSASTAGVIFTLQALSMMGTLPLAGRIIDRSGRHRAIAICGAGGAVLSTCGFALAADVPAAMTAAVAMGACFGLSQPVNATLIIRYTIRQTRPGAYSTLFWLQNLGAGLGALLGGEIVDVTKPSTFVILFAIGAILLLPPAVIFATMPALDNSRMRPRSVRHGIKLMFWRDPPMRYLLLLNAVVFFVTYGQFEVGIVAYAADVQHASPQVIGIAMTTNFALIVLLQPFTVKLVQHHRRNRVLAIAGTAWLASWAVMTMNALAAASVIATYALLGLGEVLLSPAMEPLVAELAPADLIGSYAAAIAMVRQIAIAVGPIFGGIMHGFHLYNAFLASLIACTLFMITLAFRFHRHLTPSQNRIAAPAPKRT
ncbi:MFS transporter [Streptomyces sp. NPDC060085]|uniref:MFS transporter n=1 Tax=Streptomyces sp. NPDC060085 TaxID=3347054 RepID=UPI00365DBDED